MDLTEATRQAGIRSSARRLTRLGVQHLEYDDRCEAPSGRYHGKVSAPVGRVMKTFDGHGAATLLALLDALGDAVEDERRAARSRRR